MRQLKFIVCDEISKLSNRNISERYKISKDIDILKTFKISMFVYDVIEDLMNINEAVKIHSFLM